MDDTITTAQAAAVLDIPAGYVSALARRGHLKRHVPIPGRSAMYSRREVERMAVKFKLVELRRMGQPAKSHRATEDDCETLAPAVCGLLTAADVIELERRKRKLGRPL